MTVGLRPLDEPLLNDLLDLAVRSAEPEEVMPTVAGPPGWTEDGRQAFLDFHRARFPGLAGPEATVMYGILTADGIAGMIRLHAAGTPGEYETGMWIGRTFRGRGLGAAALAALVAEVRALGGHTVVAETTQGNAAALGALRSNGAEFGPEGTSSGKVLARIRIA